MAFFRYTTDRVLTRERFVRDVHSALQAAGIQPQGIQVIAFELGRRQRRLDVACKIHLRTYQDAMLVGEHGLHTLCADTQGDTVYCWMLVGVRPTKGGVCRRRLSRRLFMRGC